MQEIYWLLLGALVVWRLTHLLHAEDGPWDLMRRFRDAVARGFAGGLFDCFYCLSLWIAAPVAWFLGSEATHKFLLWPALSAGAIIIERVIHNDDAVPAPFVEEEVEDELLRARVRDTWRDH